MTTPQHIVLLIADSLRWNTVHAEDDPRLPYITTHGINFTQARSAGCWTLPATASMFTGLPPHAHGATSQTRGLRQDVPTLAERLQRLGFTTHMVSANVVTTHIFGLHRGFTTVDRVWRLTPTQYRRIQALLVLAGKPRLRRKLCSLDFLMGTLSDDLEAAKVWLQSTVDIVLDRARQILRHTLASKQRAFCFLNLMETHFPYHIADTFETSATGLWSRLRELYSLYHLVNQTWLIRNRTYICPDMFGLLWQRQRRAWERIAAKIDAFVQEMREHHGALVVFAGDHGDNFGEQGWQYHFSNVTDAGTRVPLFWLSHDRDDARTIHLPVSTLDLFGSLLRVAGDRDPTLVAIADEPERSVPMMQSFWYNNRGRTQARFRYNQFAFVAGEQRYLYRRDRWYMAPITRAHEDEPGFQPLGQHVNPLYEAIDVPERLACVRHAFHDYRAFSALHAIEGA